MDKLIDLVVTIVSGAFIAVLAAWLTNGSRNRQEQQAEIGALRVQADAMTVAVMELQGAAAGNRLLWEGPAERARTFLLTVLAFAGGAARARIAGGTDVQSGLVSFGRAAELLSREREASKQTVAAVREPLTRAATAAAPLMRCSDPAVVTATEQLLNALSDVEDTARLEAALEAFGRAVTAATAPHLSWWARRRGGWAG
jgi:cysteine sulfinate desulfinase/cysteine desulfurase-like protein